MPEIVRAVRALNATLPRERRLRVLAPDPPIDWDQVHTHDDYQRWLAQRDSFPAQLTLREVIAKRRRVLAVWGGGHLQRKNQGSNYQQMDEPIAATYVSLLEAAGTHVFVIGGASIEEEAVRAKWPVPSIAMLRGTAAGAADQGNIPALPQRFSIRNGQLTPIPRDQWISMRVEDQLDAAIWIGPASGRRTKPLSPSSCTPEFLDRSARRRPLTGRPGPDPLKDFCATLTPK